MNTPEQIAACLIGHAARGMQKYPDFQTTTTALDTIDPYLATARAAAAAPTDPMSREQFANALAQVGGMIIKAFANLDIELVPATPVTQVPRPETPAS